MSENGTESPDPKKQTFTGLAKRLSRLPADKRRAALEVSAALAGVSLKASREFVEAVPKASKILSADDLRHWGEMGRRLAMGNAETGANFFSTGVAPLAELPEPSRHYVFQICIKQLVLSSSVSLETFRLIPALARGVNDDRLLEAILKLALEIASRSAKHSSEFLHKTPAVAARLTDFGDAKDDVAESVLNLASAFASRTGGMTADLWGNLPKVLEGMTAENSISLTVNAKDFLEFGGSVTLHFVSSGAEVLRTFDPVFDDWCSLLKKIARQGNAVLIAFLRATPKFFKQIGTLKTADGQGGSPDSEAMIAVVGRVLQLAAQIAESDAESALAAFRSSSSALRKVSLEQFEEWIETGLREMAEESSKARRSYFALETRHSHASLQEVRTGLSLEHVQTVLRIYVEGLTGKEIEVAPLAAMPEESRIGNGRTVYLPGSVAEFDDDEMNFRLYKVLAAHGAGQIEFGTFDQNTPVLRAAFVDLAELYSATADEIDAFSLAGYIEDISQADRALRDEEIRDELAKRRKSLPAVTDYKAVLQTFPQPRLARKIFSTMENARIDARLRLTYRGLRKDLDLMQGFLRKNRPFIFDIPIHQVPFELLFQITLCGGATDDSRQFYGQIVSEIEAVIESYLAISEATVADSLMATSRVYSLFQNITPEHSQEEKQSEENEETGEYAYEDTQATEAVTEQEVKREEKPKSLQDVRDLFNAWNSMDDEGEPDDLQGAEAWSHNEMPEQALEADDVAFAYDEWDRELNDYRVGWSRVIEKKVKLGDRNFVELARSRYRGVISSIRHQFQLMKPENLTKINRELDGEDYDLNALVDFVIDRRADGKQSENIYTKRLRRQRDVAVSILLDQSSSTARTITRNPLQPYTYPGRRIIEIEKEGIVLMSEALEAVGDIYSINGFTSEGRRNVKFYVVKDFSEKYSDEIERRIGGITFQNNTRLGAAIRHAAAKLLKQESRTKLLIILTDGRPYDHDYGDARYAREDVREALLEAKTHGITPFCITIDRESEAELKDLYGDVGYTIIDDVLSLPERMPNIYRRLTS